MNTNKVKKHEKPIQGARLVLSDLYDNFEHLLHIPDIDKLLAMDFEGQLPSLPQILPSLLGLVLFSPPADPPITYDRQRPTRPPPPPRLPDAPAPIDPNLRLSYEEEAVCLKHFFEILLPMLDSNPNSPWPELALKYCDFDVARLCFLALASVHMYELGEYPVEYYQKGISHMNRAMNFLISNIRLGPANDPSKLLLFIILLLIHVHLLYLCMETGRSSMTRYFLQVFALVCEDVPFQHELQHDSKKLAMMCYLSCYDTFCALVTPDCRVPFCMPQWYGTISSEMLTFVLMGCPGEIFHCFHKICHLRAAKKAGSNIVLEVDAIHNLLINYREYVPEDSQFVASLRGAQCWALAGVVALCNLSGRLPNRYILEFIDVYGCLDRTTSMVTQMVWPIHIMSVLSTTQYQRERMMAFLNFQAEFTQMRMYTLMKLVVDQVWATGKNPDDVLVALLPPGSDYLCI